MDFSDRVNYVTWGQVLDLFLNKMAPTTDEKLHLRPAPLQHEPKFKAIIHTKRESIAKIIGVSSGPTYVYIIVSKYGQVGIYDEKFRLILVMFLMVYFFSQYLFIHYCDCMRFFNYRLQRQYEIDIDTDPDSDLDVAASDPGWVTDGLWMDNSKHAVYTTSLRYEKIIKKISLSIYDFTSFFFQFVFYIEPCIFMMLQHLFIMRNIELSDSEGMYVYK